MGCLIGCLFWGFFPQINLLIKREKIFHCSWDILHQIQESRRALVNTGEKQLQIQTHFDKEMCMLNSENAKTLLGRFQLML